MEQPLLVAELKGKTIYLIPELCRMTGLSTRMREDTRLMMEVAKRTNISP
jgi:hypothetical protein